MMRRAFLFVRLPVRHVMFGIVSKRMHTSSMFFHTLVYGHRFSFIQPSGVTNTAIFITKSKKRTKMIAIRLLKLKLELKYSKKLKSYKTILIHG